MNPTDPPPTGGTEPRPPLPKYGEVVAARSEQLYYGPPPYGYPGQEPPQNRKTSTVATLALIFGAIGAFPVAIILGIVALNQLPRTREKGKGLAIAGIAAACAWLVVFGLIGFGSEPDRDAAGQVTTEADVAPQKLQVGDCVAGVDEGTVRDIEIRPCSGPNGGRVYAVFTLPAGSFPGLESVRTTAQDGCDARWLQERKKGAAPGGYIVTLHPTEASWKLGDHGVTCVLTLH